MGKILKIFIYLILLSGYSICLAQGEAKPHGIIREYYLNDKLKTEISYLGEKLDGVTKEYYESGELASEREFKDGKRDGVSRVYNENGTLQMETVYKSGKFIDAKEFNEQGKPKEGVIKEYYPAGSIWTESNYLDGRLEGLSKVYYENGKVKFELNYKAGRLINEKDFDETGNLISRKDYSQEE